MGKKGKDKSKSKERPPEKDVVEFYNGTNIFRLPNGDVYLGEYCAHVDGIIWREGNGVYQTADGQFYEGRWKDDKLIEGGEVTITYEDKIIFNGSLSKNKYQGPGVVKFPNGIQFICNFSANKPNGDVLMVDVDGRLWHGCATENNVYFSPENIFYKNIHKLRGLSKTILKQLEPEWSFPEELPEPSVYSQFSEITDQEWEKIIFAKSTKTKTEIDLEGSAWYKSFARYKNQRANVLSKVKIHTPLNKVEAKWYAKYVQSKRMKKLLEASKILRAASTKVDTTLLDRFYGKEFLESSKPYSVFYPSYDWYESVEEEVGEVEAPPLTPEEVSAEEEQVVEEAAVEEEVGLEVEEEEPKYYNLGKSIGLGTDSLYDYLDTVLKTSIPRVCNEDIQTVR